MRKITPGPIVVFSALLLLAAAIGVTVTKILVQAIPPGDFRGIVATAIGITLVYACSVALYRVFLYFAPLQEGAVGQGSTEEFRYHVYLLFYLILFQPLTRSLMVPVPLMRLVYLALGARLGRETYSAGVILDPPLTSIGDDSIVGHDAVLFAHAVEREDLSLARIRIGNRVTIGAKAVIMPGVTIEDGAIVAVGAVVSKGTRIGPGEVWGGIPARKLEAPEHVVTPGYRTRQAP